jgi:hypothetical protein
MKPTTAQIKEETETYSSVMRDLNKNDPEKIPEFMRKFKDAFDAALESDIDDHQTVALMEAKTSLGCDVDYRLWKFAQVALSNDPDKVGQTLASIVKIILSRVPHAQQDVYANIRKQLFTMSVAEIAGKSLPATAGYGQAITLIKTMLNGYDAAFIAKVLASISRHLY